MNKNISVILYIFSLSYIIRSLNGPKNIRKWDFFSLFSAFIYPDLPE